MRLNHWMCWVEGSRMPRKIHDHEIDARAEAHRLAAKEKKPVHLFCSVDTVVSQPELEPKIEP